MIAIRRIESTNLINNPTFTATDGWGFHRYGGGAASIRQEVRAGGVYSDFGYTCHQLARVAAGDQAELCVCPQLAIDGTKKHRLGWWARTYQANGYALQCYLRQLDDGNADLGELLALSAVVSNDGGAGDSVTTQAETWVNEAGGAAPALAAGTVGGKLRFVDNASAGDPGSGGQYSDTRLFGAYLVPEDRMPFTGTLARPTPALLGSGTHAGLVVGTRLYTLSHSYGQLALFDAMSLTRSAVAATRYYPHHLCYAFGALWVICEVGGGTNPWQSNVGMLQKFDPTTLALLGEWIIAGNRPGFGVDANATALYLGTGNFGGNGGSQLGDAIVKFDPTANTQTVLSTDVYSNGGSLRALPAGGSLWSFHATKSAAKRIDPSTGATQATLPLNVGTLYGLGTDGANVYYAGHTGLGIVRIADNTVTVRRFRKTFLCATNLKVDASGRVWGGAQGSATLFFYDPATDTLQEEYATGGVIKWMEDDGAGGMIVGYYDGPWLERWAATPPVIHLSIS